jgi:hypothetical protein
MRCSTQFHGSLGTGEFAFRPADSRSACCGAGKRNEAQLRLASLPFLPPVPGAALGHDSGTMRRPGDRGSFRVASKFSGDRRANGVRSGAHVQRPLESAALLLNFLLQQGDRID